MELKPTINTPTEKSSKKFYLLSPMVELWGYVLPVNVTLELVIFERWWFVDTLQMGE